MALQPCGTWAAYKRHRKLGDDPCESCRAAQQQRDAERRDYQRDRARRYYRKNRDEVLRKLREQRRVPDPRECSTCGETFTPAKADERIRFCSEPCRRRSDDERARFRQRAKERARRRRAGREGGGGYRDADIFDRDEWCCGLCHQRIDKSYCYPHPRSASIDHIVPLSRDGEDVASNVQASHLMCNLAKGANVDGQLRPVG